ncbi:MAG: hypothetical protein RBT69_09430 [Spirochaetia bacterium]|nr:hypothetical protein [Spirochaetia bacterium]
MATLTIRGCDDNLARILKRESRKIGTSVNRLVLETLINTFMGNGKKQERYNDLDSLAGTWTEDEAAEFDKAIEDFEIIDPEAWK